jgi:hypothetical protein
MANNIGNVMVHFILIPFDFVDGVPDRTYFTLDAGLFLRTLLGLRMRRALPFFGDTMWKLDEAGFLRSARAIPQGID